MGRVTFILGKGGVGRTTVARALAVRTSQDRSTLLVHTGSPPSEEHLTPKLTVRQIDPQRLLDKAVRRVLPLGPVTSTLLKHPAYESLTEIAPALRQLALLDAIEHMTRSGPDEIVVDGPATGHGLHFLQAPDKAAEVLVGRLRKRAVEIRDALRDATRSRVLIVSLPEELPVVESVELLSNLQEDGFHAPAVIVNRVPPPVPFEVEADFPTGRNGATPRQALTLLQTARAEAERWLERTNQEHDRVLTLPFIPSFDQVEEGLVPFLEGVV